MDKNIGVQYYTLRDYITTIEDFEKTCIKVREIGYKVVQISGCPLKAEDMRPVLDKYGLKVCVTHKPFDEFKNNLSDVINYNKTLGSDICGISMMPMSYFDSEEALNTFIKEANEICEVLKKEGMYFGYHNHDMEFAKVGGKVVFDRLVNETDPETFNFIIDTYWVQTGGRNPADVIEKLGKRAMIIHFKDYGMNPESVREPEMAPIGEGNLDWDKIIKAAEKSRWAVVEQDICKINPFDSVTISYNYLTKKGFC